MQGRAVTASGEISTLYDTGGSGPAVVLVHGNSNHFGSFSPLLAYLPARQYRFIGIDLPGHGASPPAQAPETCYSLPGYASVLTELVHSMDVPDAIFVGHSFGGHIILEAITDLANAAGFFVIGSPPVATPADLAEAFLPHPAAGTIFQAEMSPTDATAFDTLLSDIPDEEAEAIRRAYKETDPQARLGLGASVMAGRFRDEALAINNSKARVAVICSVNDPLINARYFDQLETNTLDERVLWRGRVQRLTDYGHWPHLQTPNVIGTLLTDFLDDCHGFNDATERTDA
jgi:pimeloyl-ACP methyl ester carboxylesterase